MIKKYKDFIILILIVISIIIFLNLYFSKENFEKEIKEKAATNYDIIIDKKNDIRIVSISARDHSLNRNKEEIYPGANIISYTYNDKYIVTQHSDKNFYFYDIENNKKRNLKSDKELNSILKKYHINKKFKKTY